MTQDKKKVLSVKEKAKQVEQLYNDMVEMLGDYIKEENKKIPKNAPDAIEQAIWWYCNDRHVGGEAGLEDIMELSKHKPKDNESGVDKGLATELYDLLSDMMES